MIDAFIDAMEYVTVAVCLDDQSVNLVKVAGRIAARLGKALCILHVVEPWSAKPAARILGEKSTLWDVATGLDADLKMRATEALDRLADAAGVPSARLLVTTGSPRACLGDEALEVGSCLLVIGRGGTVSRHLPQSFSTVLSLMAKTPVPLLVIDPVKQADFPGDAPRILVADDLSDKGEAALRAATIFATGLRNSWLHHVHVNAMTRAVLDAGIIAAGTAAHTQIPEAAATTDIYTLLVAALDRAMEERIEPLHAALAASGGKYTREVVDGPTRGELQEAIAVVHPDVVALGRHHSMHEAHTGFARLATRAMIAGDAAVLIVPDL